MSHVIRSYDDFVITATFGDAHSGLQCPLDVGKQLNARQCGRGLQQGVRKIVRGYDSRSLYALQFRIHPADARRIAPIGGGNGETAEDGKHNSRWKRTAQHTGERSLGKCDVPGFKQEVADVVKNLSFHEGIPNRMLIRDARVSKGFLETMLCAGRDHQARVSEAAQELQARAVGEMCRSTRVTLLTGIIPAHLRERAKADPSTNAELGAVTAACEASHLTILIRRLLDTSEPAINPGALCQHPSALEHVQRIIGFEQPVDENASKVQGTALVNVIGKGEHAVGRP